MAIAQEIEAKLLAPELAVLEHIAKLRRVGAHRLLPRRRAQLETVYLDTEDFALLAAGACLRVRRDGQRYEATAKWMGEVRQGVHARPELTVALPRDQGDALRTLRSRAGFSLPRGPLHEQLAAIVAGRALRPILTTRIDRRVIDVVRWRGSGQGGGVVAELALDRVRAEGPNGHRASGAEYGEVELELRGGTLAEVRALADGLRRAHGLVPTHETKLSRGLALVHGAQLLARARQKAEVDAPAVGDSVGAALRKALCVQLQRIRAHDPGTRSGEDAEALHQQRVGVRRARATLRALGSALPSRRAAYLARELRWLGRALGTVRDLDVQLAGCEQLAHALPESERSALRGYAEELSRQREQARQALLRALDSTRYFELLLELQALSAERSEHVAAGRPERMFAHEGHARAQRALLALRRRGRELAPASRAPSADALHALRIRARRTRYLLELLAPLADAPARRVIARLTRIQDCLGGHQDAVVAQAAIAAYRVHLHPAGSRALRDALRLIADRERRRAERSRRDFAKAFRLFDRDFRDVERMLARIAKSAESATGGAA